MQELYLSLNQLRGMIGLRILYSGTTYTVIEVLEDNPCIVVQADQPDSHIQADAYGNARRQVRDTLTIPVFSNDKTELHVNFLRIDLL